jgi:hypothetical protein
MFWFSDVNSCKNGGDRYGMDSLNIIGSCRPVPVDQLEERRNLGLFKINWNF